MNLGFLVLCGLWLGPLVSQTREVNIDTNPVSATTNKAIAELISCC